MWFELGGNCAKVWGLFEGVRWGSAAQGVWLVANQFVVCYGLFGCCCPVRDWGCWCRVWLASRETTRGVLFVSVGCCSALDVTGFGNWFEFGVGSCCWVCEKGVRSVRVRGCPVLLPKSLFEVVIAASTWYSLLPSKEHWVVFEDGAQLIVGAVS